MKNFVVISACCCLALGGFATESLSVASPSAGETIIADKDDFKRFAEQGDFALGQKDYAMAEGYYSAALAATPASDATAKSRLYLKKGEVQLLAGKLDAAEQTWNEYQKEFGAAANGGIFQPRLLVAQGKIEEAEKILEDLWKARGDISKDEVSFLLGCVRYELALRAVREKNFTVVRKYLDSADKAFDELVSSKFSVFLLPANRCKFLILLENAKLAKISAPSAKDAKSQAVADKFFNQARQLRNRETDEREKIVLSMFLAVAEEKWADFTANWALFTKKDLTGRQLFFKAEPDKLLFNLMLSAAELAAKNNDITLVSELCSAAANKFYSYPVERQLANKIEFNNLMKKAPAVAEEVAEKYRQTYPNDLGYPNMCLELAKIYVNQVNPPDYEKAIKKFRAAVNSKLPLSDRVAAARGGAAVAEKISDPKDAEWFYNKLCDVLLSGEEKQKEFLRLTEFYLRCNKFDEARKTLGRYYGDTPQEAERLRLEIAFRSGDYQTALHIARELKKSATAKISEYAAFIEAQIVGRDGSFAEAEKLFNDFAKRYPKSEYLEEAQFLRVYMLTLRPEGKTDAIVNELKLYAESHPRTAPEAYYLAVRRLCRDTNAREVGLKKAGEIIDIFRKNYPDAPIRSDAVIEYATLCWNMDQLDKAEDVLEKLSRSGKISSAAEMLYVRILLERGSLDAATSRISDYENKPTNDVAKEKFLYLSALVSYKEENFDEAVKKFSSAADICEKNSLLYDLCKLGQADSLFKFSNPSKIKQAAELYEMIGNTSRFGNLRLRALAHLGECMAQLDDDDKAVAAWKNALYTARSLRNAGERPRPELCLKCHDDAIKILRKNNKEQDIQLIENLLAEINKVGN